MPEAEVKHIKFAEPVFAMFSMFLHDNEETWQEAEAKHIKLAEPVSTTHAVCYTSQMIYAVCYAST